MAIKATYTQVLSHDPGHSSIPTYSWTTYSNEVSVEDWSQKLRWKERPASSRPSWFQRHYCKVRPPDEEPALGNCWGFCLLPIIVGARVFVTRIFSLYDIVTDIAVALELLKSKEPLWIFVVCVLLIVTPILMKLLLFRHLSMILLTLERSKGGWGLSVVTANILYVCFGFFFFATADILFFVLYPWTKPRNIVLTPLEFLSPVIETLFESTGQMAFQYWMYRRVSGQQDAAHHRGDHDNTSELETLRTKLLLSLVPGIVNVIYRFCLIKTEASAVGKGLCGYLPELVKAPLGISAPFLDLMGDKSVGRIDYTGVGLLSLSQQRQIFEALGHPEAVLEKLIFDDGNMLDLENNAQYMQGNSSLRTVKFGFNHSLEDANAVLQAMIYKGRHPRCMIGMIDLDTENIQAWLAEVGPSLERAGQLLQPGGLSGCVVECRNLISKLEKQKEGSGLIFCRHADALQHALEGLEDLEQTLRRVSMHVDLRLSEMMKLEDLETALHDAGDPFEEAMQRATEAGLDASIVRDTGGAQAAVKVKKQRQILRAMKEVASAATSLCDGYNRLSMTSQSKKFLVNDSHVKQSQAVLKDAITEAISSGVQDDMLMKIEVLQRAKDILQGGYTEQQDKHEILRLIWEAIDKILAVEMSLNPFEKDQTMKKYGPQLLACLQRASEKGIDPCAGKSATEIDSINKARALIDGYATRFSEVKDVAKFLGLGMLK